MKPASLITRIKRVQQGNGPLVADYTCHSVVLKDGSKGVLVYDPQLNAWDIRDSWGIVESPLQLEDVQRLIQSWDYIGE